MRKTLFTITLLISIVINLFSQDNNYKEGYYITNSNDTIYGLIDFRTNKMNARQCNFRSSQNSDIQIFQPQDISAYKLIKEDLYYVSKNIEINNTQQQVFLQYLVKGMLNLYYYVDKNDIVYYLFEEDGKITTISKQEDKIENNSVISDKKYIGILNYMFQGHPSITKNLNNLNYNQKSMIDIAEKYHNETCTTGEGCVIYVDKNPDKGHAKVKFSAYTGIQFLTYKFHKSKNSYTNASPMIGVQIDLSAPRWSNSLSMLLDVSFSQMKKETEYVQAADYYSYKIDYEAIVNQIRLGLKYAYPKYKIRPTIEVGVAWTNFINPSASSYEYHHPPYEYTKEYEYDLPTSHFGFYGAIGVDYNIRKNSFLFIRAAYEGYLNQEATQENGEDGLKTFYIKMGYTF